MFSPAAAILSADLIGKDGRQRSDNLSARPVQAVSKFCEWSDTGRNTHRTSLRCDAPRVLSSFSGRVPAEVNDGFRYGGDCECSPRFAAFCSSLTLGERAISFRMPEKKWQIPAGHRRKVQPRGLESQPPWQSPDTAVRDCFIRPSWFPPRSVAAAVGG